MNRKTGCRNKTSEVKDADQNKWMTPLVRCNKNFTKFKREFEYKILIDFIDLN
jgi:hypothetical protein